ncbi:MAG: hypothetical protein AAF608_05055 [Pseudomonadota bacterium]
MFRRIIDNNEEEQRKALMEQAMAEPAAPAGPPEGQAMQSRGLIGQLGARLGIGDPLTDFERESAARARAHGLGFAGTGLGATKAVQFAMDDLAERDYQAQRNMEIAAALEAQKNQANLLKAQSDRFIRTDTGVFDALNRQFLTDQQFVEMQAADRAAQQASNDDVVGAQQFVDTQGNLYSVSTAKSGGGLVIKGADGKSMKQLPQGAVPIDDAGIADMNRRSVERYDEFAERSVNAASQIEKNKDTIRLIEENAGAFGPGLNDALGRMMTQTLGIEYAGLDQTDMSALSARFAESQLNTVQRYLAGTGPVTEAEQAIAARFSGSFDMSAQSAKQLFQLQNFLLEKDKQMRSDWSRARLPEREFVRWRNEWVENNENLDELEQIFAPDQPTPPANAQDGFQQAGRFRYRIKQ